MPTEVHHDVEDEIVIHAEEQEIFTEHQYLLQTHPKMKKKIYMECYEYLTSQKKGINAILEDQQKCKKQVRFALKKLIKEWRMKVQKRIEEGVGADELALQCIPHARRSEAKKKKKPSVMWKEKAKSKMKSLKKKEKLIKKAKGGKENRRRC